MPHNHLENGSTDDQPRITQASRCDQIFVVVESLVREPRSLLACVLVDTRPHHIIILIIIITHLHWMSFHNVEQTADLARVLLKYTAAQTQNPDGVNVRRFVWIERGAYRVKQKVNGCMHMKAHTKTNIMRQLLLLLLCDRPAGTNHLRVVVDVT